MSVVYSMYDALVSINVPDEKAKAVIDAMEREMMDKLATKSDVAHVREVLSHDIRALEIATKADLGHMRELLSKDFHAVSLDLAHARELLSQDIKSLAMNIQSLDQKFATKADLSELARKTTTQLYMGLAGSTALTCSILGALTVLSR